MRRCAFFLSAFVFLIGVAQAQVFAPCEDAQHFPELNGTLCATFDAPLRAPGPLVGGASESIHLFVRKFPATGTPKGSVWLIAGGPGESGATFYPLMEKLKESFAHFDILIPDHRGTGFSTRLCPVEESPASPGGMALAGAEWGSCWAALNAAPDYARAFSVTNAAYDLSELLAKAREPGATYLYSVSYGTQLALRLLQLDHPHLDGVILDSLTPPEGSTQWDLSHRSQIVDQVGRAVLHRCDRTPACRARFPGGIEAAYAELIASGDQAMPDIGSRGGYKTFFGTLLDFSEVRARIPDLIAELPHGDKRSLNAAEASLSEIGAALSRYPQSPSSIPLVTIISSSENNARPDLTKAQIEREEAGLLFVSTLPHFLVAPGLPAYQRDRHFGGSIAPNSPRILVLQGSLDPKTPLAGALARAAELRKHARVTFVRVEDAPHFVLLNAPNCFEQTTQAFIASRRISPHACRVPSAHSAL